MWHHVATMATRMGIRELRDGLTAAIRRVRAGETIEVTHDGVPVALLTPIPESKLDRLIASGLATPPRRPLTLPPRLLGPAGSKTTTAIIEEDRDDDR